MNTVCEQQNVKHTSLTNYTGCHRRNRPNFGRVFLMLNYTDITQNTYIQSWTVMEIMAIEKCGLLWCPRTVSRPIHHIHPLRKPGNEKPLSNIGMQWHWRDNSQLLPASITWKPKANVKVVRVFLYFNLMALCHSQVTLMLSTDINITETTYQ